MCLRVKNATLSWTQLDPRTLCHSAMSYQAVETALILMKAQELERRPAET